MHKTSSKLAQKGEMERQRERENHSSGTSEDHFPPSIIFRQHPKGQIKKIFFSKHLSGLGIFSLNVRKLSVFNWIISAT